MGMTSQKTGEPKLGDAIGRGYPVADEFLVRALAAL
jgi:hypothetical protein